MLANGPVDGSPGGTEGHSTSRRWLPWRRCSQAYCRASIRSGGAGTVPGGQEVARGVHRTRGRINCRQRSPTHTKLTNTNLARSEALKELELPTLGLITSHSGWTGRGGRGRGRRGRRGRTPSKATAC